MHKEIFFLCDRLPFAVGRLPLISDGPLYGRKKKLKKITFRADDDNLVVMS